MTDSVSLLRQAADRIEQLATASGLEHAPWDAQPTGWADLNGPADGVWTAQGACLASFDVAADAEWIATMHPGIAKPLAAWLRYHVPPGRYDLIDHQLALDLARAILHTEGTSDR